MPTDPLAADAHPLLALLFVATCALYGLAGVVTAVRPAAGRGFLLAALVVHAVSALYRAEAIGFFPLTNKHESFSAAAFFVALAAWATWRPQRLYALSLIVVSLGALAAAFAFPLDLVNPPPLMRTLWYPLHVPLSFFAYGLWTAAGAAGACWLVEREPRWLNLIDQLALQGFGLWSLSMICGGIWGVVAWGAYFLWDPKIIWSVILWFHYASFVHLRLTPSLAQRPWVRPVLAFAGVAWIFVTYVGTSFFFGRSSHAFG